MAWDMTTPINNTKISDFPSEIRSVKASIYTDAMTMASKIMALPVLHNPVIAKTRAVYAAATGVVQLVATSVQVSTSGLVVITPDNTAIPIIKDNALYASTGFSIVRTADMNSNIVFRNNYSTAAAGQIAVANYAGSSIVSILLGGADANDAGSLELGAAAATASGRGAAILMYGTDHATYPAQIRLRRGSASTGFISACTSIIKNVVNPVDAQDAATMGYVDSRVTTYSAGGQSITLGTLTIKFGMLPSATANAVTDVDYTVDFDNDCIACFASYSTAATFLENPCAALKKSGSEKHTIQIVNGDSSVRNIYWLAIGY